MSGIQSNNLRAGQLRNAPTYGFFKVDLGGKVQELIASVVSLQPRPTVTPGADAYGYDAASQELFEAVVDQVCTHPYMRR